MGEEDREDMMEEKQCVRCGRAGHDSDECPWPLVKRVGRNTQGRDFIVGDIHGHFKKLSAKLGEVGFDPDEGDRLFSVGDLVDRGPESESVLQWLARPWFFPVAGNHEDMAVRWPNGNMDAGLYMRNGGTWNVTKTRDESLQYADALAMLPIAIELETSRGLIGIVHADCPCDRWQEFTALLETPDISRSRLKDIISSAQWDRMRLELPGLRGPIAGVRAVVVGHTPQQEPTWSDNVLYIDTGGWHPSGAGFTVIDAEMLLPVGVLSPAA